MPLLLISATPSPFARINRIAMLEKSIPFTLQNEIPWHKAETMTPTYNPLEKLPILLNPDDPTFEPVYDSSHIQEYIIQKYADKSPRLLTGDVDLDLKARQVQVLCQGVLDALVLRFFETSKGEGKTSVEWIGRQTRKIEGGTKALNELVLRAGGVGKYLVGNVYTIADIAVSCTISHIEFMQGLPEWQKDYPEMAKWWAEMDQREHYASTRPVMFDIRVPDIIA